jgi:hypothetical protein
MAAFRSEKVAGFVGIRTVAARWALGAGLFCRVEVEFLFSVLAVTY